MPYTWAFGKLPKVPSNNGRPLNLLYHRFSTLPRTQTQCLSKWQIPVGGGGTPNYNFLFGSGWQSTEISRCLCHYLHIYSLYIYTANCQLRTRAILLRVTTMQIFLYTHITQWYNCTSICQCSLFIFVSQKFEKKKKTTTTKSQIIFDSLKITLPDTCIIIIIVS